MSNVEYISRVYLLNVPLELDYKHTLYFGNKETQKQYFMSRKVAQFTDFHYIRKDNILRVPSKDDNHLATSLDDLLHLGVNYVMYQNTKYSNKWFYAFIKDLKYVNDETTEIYIETDVLQTWETDYTLKQSFVEREHVVDDTIGTHTLPENVEKGEYVCNQHYVDEDLDDVMTDLCYIVASTLSTTEKITNSEGVQVYKPSTGGRYNGIYSGTKYYAYTSPSDINKVLDNYAGTGQVDAVNGLFIAPRVLAEATNNVVNESTSPYWKEVEVEKNNKTIDGYTPRNKKLLTYPYNYLLASNNNGGNVIYRYEDFSNGDNATFGIEGVLCPGCSVRLIPTNYKGATENDEEGFNLGKYPSCNWATDMYTNWMTQNAQSIAVSNAKNISDATVGAVASLFSADLVGGLYGSISNGAFGIAQTMAEIDKQSMTPPQANGNLNCGDVITASGKNTFHFYKMSIKKEYARLIDKFFDLFGYKVNDLKIPNKAHRPEYWYTKTIDVNIDGAIPQDDMQKIKNCYNNGITFWVNPDHIQNYNVTNTF